MTSGYAPNGAAEQARIIDVRRQPPHVPQQPIGWAGWLAAFRTTTARHVSCDSDYWHRQWGKRFPVAEG